MSATLPGTPLYWLFEDELDREILSAHDVEGFFVDEPQPESSLVRLIGTTIPPETPPQRFEDVELRVVDVAGRVMSHYYIGTVELTAVLPGGNVPGVTNALVSLGGYALLYPGAREIWRRWASGVPIEPGEWRAYAPELYESWLHVVQQSWFGSGHRAARYGKGEQCVVDGSEMVNIAGFYCALGEAVNGPGGYFGSNPSALEDCLINRQPGEGTLRLMWRNFKESEQGIDREELGYVLSVLRRCGVDLALG